DGQWIRSLHWFASQGDLPAEPSSIGLQKGGPKGLSAFRPHTALFSDDRMRRRLLSDFLTAEYWDEHNKYRYLVEYLGEENVNDLRCQKLRLGAMYDNQKQPQHQFFFIWLAKDHSYIPIRSEHVDLAWSDRIPTGVAYVDDLREVVPGLWLPYHVVEMSHDNWGRDGTGSGQVLIGWRRDRRIESINLEPDVSDELFVPAVAEGSMVYVSNESGHGIGRIHQKGSAPPQVDDAKFAVMAEIARVDQRDFEDRKRRQAALDALAGTRLPEFSEATWLNGPKLSNESLAGKVLLIEFCAEWWQPCENDLKQLGKIERDLAADGVKVIAIHTARSEEQDIERLAEELKFGGPIYVDSPDAGATSRWGRLFEKLAVRELPHTFVVDRQGNIAAHGRLDKMITQARALSAQGPGNQ
ncbi:MAG: TlpA disulfide reductase family protein, partial [Pirellulales bacterium]